MTEILSQDKAMMLKPGQERLPPFGPGPDDGLFDPPQPKQLPRRSPHSRSAWAQVAAITVAAHRVRMRAIRSRAERTGPCAAPIPGTPRS